MLSAIATRAGRITNAGRDGRAYGTRTTGRGWPLKDLKNDFDAPVFGYVWDMSVICLALSSFASIGQDTRDDARQARFRWPVKAHMSNGRCGIVLAFPYIQDRPLRAARMGLIVRCDSACKYKVHSMQETPQ